MYGGNEPFFLLSSFPCAHRERFLIERKNDQGRRISRRVYWRVRAHSVRAIGVLQFVHTTAKLAATQPPLTCSWRQAPAVK